MHAMQICMQQPSETHRAAACLSRCVHNDDFSCTASAICNQIIFDVVIMPMMTSGFNVSGWHCSSVMPQPIRPVHADRASVIATALGGPSQPEEAKAPLGPRRTRRRAAAPPLRAGECRRVGDRISLACLTRCGRRQSSNNKWQGGWQCAEWSAATTATTAAARPRTNQWNGVPPTEFDASFGPPRAWYG